MSRSSIPLPPERREPAAVEGEIPRRNFLARASAAVIGALLVLIPLVPGLAFLLDPLLRRRGGSSGDGEGFVLITTTDLIGEQPQKFPVVMDRRDAWNQFPNQQIGNVILRKTTDGPIGSADQIEAFTDICPHLGCTVDYKPGAPPDKAFKCPCHASAFSLDGQPSNAIPPRGLDPLPVELRHGNQVWIKYEKFAAGTHERQVIS